MHAPEQIYYAATIGDLVMTQQLIEENSDLVNRYADEGWTPLHLAAYFGHTQVARALISSGADPQARSHNFMENMPLHAAVAGRKCAVVEMLLDTGADVNARQDGGWTALHEAALFGCVDLVLLLIERGAAVNQRNDDGVTPLGLAIEKDHKQVVEALRSHGGKE